MGGITGVDELLRAGAVSPDFRESGDPTERGQQGKQITGKVRKQTVGIFKHAARVAFGDATPATLLLSQIDSKMCSEDGSLTPGVIAAIDDAFYTLSAGNAVMDRDAVARYLTSICRNLSEPFDWAMHEPGELLAVKERFDASGQEHLTCDEFRSIYKGALAEGKFWAVEYDLRTLRGSGMAVPSEGPCELSFDHIYFTSALRLIGVQEPLTEERKQSIWGSPFDVLPNEWHPSDHLPVAAAFAFAQ